MCSQSDDPSEHDRPPTPKPPRAYVLSGSRPRRKLGLSTPWARQSATAEDIAYIEALIPDGMQLGVGMTPSRHKYRFWYHDIDGGPNLWDMQVSAGIGLRRAAEFALRHHGITGEGKSNA